MSEIHQWHGLDLTIVFECLLLMTVICLIVGVRWGRRSILVAALFFATASWAANTALFNLTAASSVGGTDLFYDVQGGGATEVKATAAQIATYVKSTLGTTAGTWTPVDNSGAALTFTGVSAGYTQIGNMVFAYAQLTYPTTSDMSTASIGGLPVSVPAHNYAQSVCAIGYFGGTSVLSGYPVQNTTTMNFISSIGGVAHNSDFSTVTVTFQCIYPAS